MDVTLWSITFAPIGSGTFEIAPGTVPSEAAAGLVDTRQRIPPSQHTLGRV